IMEHQPRKEAKPSNTLRACRKWLRWLAVPVAAATLAIAYRLTRPSELVWWRSEPIRGFGHPVKMLVPSGWEVVAYMPPFTAQEMEHSGYAMLVPPDCRPRFIRWLFPDREVISALIMEVHDHSFPPPQPPFLPPNGIPFYSINDDRKRDDAHMWVQMTY